MIGQADLRVIKMMIEKTNRIIEICKLHSRDEIQAEYVLSDALQYEFEKLYEDTTRLSIEFRLSNEWLEIDKMRGIRNRIAHDYESVILNILIDTAEINIPELNEVLNKIVMENS